MRHDGKEGTRRTFVSRLWLLVFHLLPVCVSSGSAEQMFWEVMRLRREMTTARLGFYVADQG